MVARQTPLSMLFSRQEYWSGLPFPSPEDLPDPGIEPASPALAGRFFITVPPGKPTFSFRFKLFAFLSVATNRVWAGPWMHIMLLNKHTWHASSCRGLYRWQRLKDERTPLPELTALRWDGHQVSGSPQHGECFQWGGLHWLLETLNPQGRRVLPSWIGLLGCWTSKACLARTKSTAGLHFSLSVHTFCHKTSQPRMGKH